MGENYSSAAPDDGKFDKTRWSMVLAAVQSRAPCAQKALAELCGLYWRPLYAFAGLCDALVQAEGRVRA